MFTAEENEDIGDEDHVAAIKPPQHRQADRDRDGAGQGGLSIHLHQRHRRKDYAGHIDEMEQDDAENIAIARPSAHRSGITGSRGDRAENNESQWRVDRLVRVVGAPFVRPIGRVEPVHPRIANVVEERLGEILISEEMPE
jgi:hypothetical protein